MRALEAELRAGLRALGLELSDAQCAHLLDYLGLIQKWNKVYNLTSVREPADMLTHHVLDSLAAAEPLRAQLKRLAAAGREARNVLDVGSGAGLPGVVLAVVFPELSVDCVDTVAKKAAFIQQVAVTLGLTNLRGLHDRVERLGPHYGVVCSRAFASLSDFTTWSAGALAEGGVWMGMKGKEPVEELAQLPAGVEVFHVEPLTVPGLEAQRCIVWMHKTGE